jgi:hypothetical protein
MTGDWEVMNGLKKGEIPNPVVSLYKAYVKWCEKHGAEVSEQRAWLQYMTVYRGYKVEKVRERKCLMMSKWAVPKSTLYKIRRKPRAICKHCGSRYTPK